jgi:hypothetical protein
LIKVSFKQCQSLFHFFRVFPEEIDFEQRCHSFSSRQSKALVDWLVEHLLGIVGGQKINQIVETGLIFEMKIFLRVNDQIGEEYCARGFVFDRLL